MRRNDRTRALFSAIRSKWGIRHRQVAELATLDSETITVDSDEIAEIDRRWKKIEAGQPKVPHERVVRSRFGPSPFDSASRAQGSVMEISSLAHCRCRMDRCHGRRASLLISDTD
jgi:hypothetical protein